MHDASLVGCVQTLCQLLHDMNHSPRGYEASARQGRQRGPVQEFHDKVGSARSLVRVGSQSAKITNINDMRAADGGGRSGFVDKALRDFWIGGEVSAKDFYRNLLIYFPARHISNEVHSLLIFVFE